jgi:hypothetical protein
VDGWSQESFDMEVDYLMQCGFLVDAFSLDDVHVLEFRIPYWDLRLGGSATAIDTHGPRCANPWRNS